MSGGSYFFFRCSGAASRLSPSRWSTVFFLSSFLGRLGHHQQTSLAELVDEVGGVPLGLGRLDFELLADTGDDRADRRRAVGLSPAVRSPRIQRIERAG